MANYDYVLFDADNTLFDFDAAEHAALTATLTHYGLPTDEAVRARYQDINAALWTAHDRGEIARDALVVERFAALLRHLDTHHDPVELNAYYLARLGEDARLLPGAEELCRTLAPCCTMAIVTNGVAAVQRGRFARSPLKALFPHIFISEELGCQKPEKSFFDLVFHAMGITSSSRTVLVGDSLSADIQGAVNAGIPSIWYNPRGLPVKGGAAPTYIAAQFSSISSILLD